METLPSEVCHKIFCSLDYHNLAAVQRVCRKWNDLASDNSIWANLFRERWGEDQAAFFSPAEAQSWRHVYSVQDRCDRYGLGVKIIREGEDYYLISRGEIQRRLGLNQSEALMDVDGEESSGVEANSSIFDKILCFIGDLETASAQAKRRRTI